MRYKPGKRRGSALVEFTLCAILLIFTIISVVQLSMTMWNYHTLAEAVNYATRAASSRGAGCVGKACATTVGTIATMISSHAIGIPASAINVTLTSSASGVAAVTCNPLSSCSGSATAWPTVAANAAGTDLTIKATYVSSLPIPMYAPKYGGSRFQTVTLAAQSRQMVVY